MTMHRLAGRASLAKKGFLIYLRGRRQTRLVDGQTRRAGTRTKARALFADRDRVGDDEARLELDEEEVQASRAKLGLSVASTAAVAFENSLLAPKLAD